MKKRGKRVHCTFSVIAQILTYKYNQKKVNYIIVLAIKGCIQV